MKRKISYYLGQNGYLKMLTNLPEFTIFFKREYGFVSMIEVVDLEENPFVTEDTLKSVTQKAQWRFMDQGCEEVHYLVLVITDRYEQTIRLGENERFLWFLDRDSNRLIVPEDKAEDFYGMREMIEQWLLTDFDEEVQQEEVYQVNGWKVRKFRQQPLVNHGIFLINVIVFTFCTLSGDLLYNYGRLSIQEVLNGEWYRIITALFLHGDMAHLAGNMIMLFFMGDIVEKELGHIRYLILYLGAGIAGAFASLYLQFVRLQMGADVAGSIGASGAIFGMLGGMLWILIRNKGRLAEMSFLRVLFLVCYTLYGGLMSSNVDNAAHLGGLLSGFLLAVLLYRKKKKPKEREKAYEN